MNVLITGGAGFIGSALADRLAADGHRLAVVDSRSAPAALGPPPRTAGGHDTGPAPLRAVSGIASGPGDAAPCPPAPRAAPSGAPAWLVANIAGPARPLDAFFDAVRPDAVVHLAAQASVVESVLDPVGGAAVNVCGTVNLLNLCLAFGVRRFVFASTGGALYGDTAPQPTPETVPPAPLSPYGASKAAAEQYVRAMSRQGAMGCTILRLGNVYGPGRAADGESGVVSAFARAMLGGDHPVIHGDGLSERDYVHVHDVIEAFRLALGMRGDGVFNIAAGTAHTVREVFDAVARAVRYPHEPVYAPARAGELRRCRLDIARAARELGWRPRVPFERGVARTVDAMRAQVSGHTAAGASR